MAKAKYRVKEKSFIDNKLYDVGDEVEFDGIAHRNLEPLDKTAEKSAANRIDPEKESEERQRAAAAGVDLNDNEAFAKWKEASNAAKKL